MKAKQAKTMDYIITGNNAADNHEKSKAFKIAAIDKFPVFS